MPDPNQISEIIGSIKNATDIAKAIRVSDSSLEKAELKLRLAELLEALIDAKLQIAEIQELFREKNAEIANLRSALELRFHLVRSGLAYYKTDNEKRPVGEPFCSYCWEVNHKTIHLHLTNSASGSRICPSCKNIYAKQQTEIIDKHTKGGRW